ncbi:MAG: hypothetical protein IKJ26_12845 [Clostridia bacterium]|nr:hypothetical protein [Clostridia bacterium]
MNKNMTRHDEPEAQEIPQKQNTSDEVVQIDMAYCARLCEVLIQLGRCLEVAYMFREHSISEAEAQKRITTIIEELERA